MSTPITKYVKDAALLLFRDQFNGLMTSVAPEYGIDSFSVDWSDASQQFFLANVTPDNMEESDNVIYPMVTLHGVRSRNTHESMQRIFSGPVELALSFYLTTKTEEAGNAGSELEITCDAIEDACNLLLTNGNWPQGYGATNAVCLPPACERGPLEEAAEGWRQQIEFALRFTVDTN